MKYQHTVVIKALSEHNK